MMAQDFSKKMTVVLRESLASWQLANTIGHIAAYLGNKMKEPFDTGEYFASKDGINFPRNSQFAIIALSAKEEELKNLAAKLYGAKLPWIAYIQEMIDMIDDGEISEKLSTINADQMDILGIGIFGPKEELKELTGAFRLWK